MKAEYHLHSVAFPNVPRPHRVVDELGVQAGGSEFYFRWIELGPTYPHGALRIECFTDGIPALKRVLLVILQLEQVGDVPPARLIQMLEDIGVEPSHYHLNPT